MNKAKKQLFLFLTPKTKVSQDNLKSFLLVVVVFYSLLRKRFLATKNFVHGKHGTLLKTQTKLFVTYKALCCCNKKCFGVWCNFLQFSERMEKKQVCLEAEISPTLNFVCFNFVQKSSKSWISSSFAENKNKKNV